MKEFIKRIHFQKMNFEKMKKEWNISAFITLIRRNYGIFTLIMTEILLALILVFFGDSMYVAVNDNLDSNIVLMKIFRDNNCWLDRSTPLPFLGGMSRDLLTCGYTLQYINYWIFDTQIAYWVNFLESIAISAMGFYFLGKSVGMLTGKKISPEMFCIGGILYSLIGFWPHRIIDFALIPWWAYFILEFYRTKKWWLGLFFIPLLYNISGPLIGVFLIFYTLMFYLAATIKEKKFLREMTVLFGFILIVFVFFNRSMIFQSLGSSKDTIKGLANQNGVVYSASIKECFSELKGILLLNSRQLYHSGVVSLRDTALLLLVVFLIFFNLERKKMNISKDFLIIYNLTFLSYLFNALAMSFDNCASIRRFLPFLSGFSFARFVWLSPFILIIGFLMILYFLCGKGLKKTSVLLVLFLLFGIIRSNKVDKFGSLYNNVSVNYIMNVRHFHLEEQSRWEEYYNTKLYDKIKQEIGYNGEWVVAYAFDPSIIQYNGFKTLDGYYSNYPLEYKKKWEEMIMPTLKASEYTKSYWHETNGQRAYIYTPNYGYAGHDTEPMLIKVDILEELGCKYVISRVKIENDEELGFEYLGTWDDDYSDSQISVYSVGNH